MKSDLPLVLSFLHLLFLFMAGMQPGVLFCCFFLRGCSGWHDVDVFFAPKCLIFCFLFRVLWEDIRAGHCFSAHTYIYHKGIFGFSGFGWTMLGGEFDLQTHGLGVMAGDTASEIDHYKVSQVCG